MLVYKALNKQIFTTDGFYLVPIRFEDRYDIMKWRNEQIYHLRQKEPLTIEQQDVYFENVVAKLFEQVQPNQILFSFLKNEELIGYGGLVHINWEDKNAEVSFIMDSVLEKDRFQELWLAYLKLIEEVVFHELSFHKMYTYAFDLRPYLYETLGNAGFVEDAKLKSHAIFEGKPVDVVIHSKFNDTQKSLYIKKAIYGNVLICSCSKKVGLVKALKEAAKNIAENIKVIAGDISPNALSQYFADEFYVMPETMEENKVILLVWLKEKNIKAIVPSRDAELLFWANWKEELLANGISVMVSNAKAVKICLDKFAFSEFCLASGIPAIPAHLVAGEISTEHLVVKERFGAGSLSMALRVDFERAVSHAKTLENPIFQPFKKGREISVDAYITKSGQVKGLITRYRKIVENGESVITETFYSESLSNELKIYIEKLNLYGHVILQLIIDDNTNEHYLIECNPRFGGASTLSLKAGLNSFYWFLQEAHGVSIENYPFQRLNQILTQIRFPQDLIIYGDHF
jgi:RimJ/RimL family protein N-acetyltransferase